MSREALAAPGAAALPFSALWLFTFILLVAPQALIPPLAAVRPALVVGVIAIAIHLADRGRRRPPVAGGLALAGTLLAWAVATLPLSYWPGGSVTFLTGLYVKTLALFWLVCEIVNTRRRLLRIVWALAVMSAVPAAVTLTNYLSGRLRGERVLGYETALGANPNDIALLLTVLLPLALGLFALERRPAVRVALAIIVVLDVAAVVITFSRGGFLALLVALALALGPWRRRVPYAARGTRAGLIVLLLLIALALPGGYLAHMATIGDIDADPTGSAQARWTDMKAAVRFIAAHPVVGSGIGNDILALNEARGPLWKSVHNVYLQYGVELGLPGLALFVALMVSAVRAARAARRLAERQGDNEGAVLARAVQVALATFAVAGFFSTAGYHFPFYYLAGLAIAARTVAARAVVTAPVPVAPPLATPVLAGAGAGAGAGWWRR
jgi:O-antigen ligase